MSRPRPSLFDDSSDDEDTPVARTPSVPKPKKAGLFHDSDSDDEIFGGKSASSPKDEEVPSGGPPKSDPLNEVSDSVKAKQSESVNADPLTESSSTEEAKADGETFGSFGEKPKVQEGGRALATTIRQEVLTVHEDDEPAVVDTVRLDNVLGEDMFLGAEKETDAAGATAKLQSLELDSQKRIAARMQGKKASMFDDDDDDEEEMGQIYVPKSVMTVEDEPAVQKSSEDTSSSAAGKSTSLFDDSDEEDATPAPSRPVDVEEEKLLQTSEAMPTVTDDAQQSADTTNDDSSALFAKRTSRSASRKNTNVDSGLFQMVRPAGGEGAASPELNITEYIRKNRLAGEKPSSKVSLFDD